MRKLVWDASFRRAFKRKTQQNAPLARNILDVLTTLSISPFQPSLKTHKLRGALEGLWACWVDYDCRIIFTFEPDVAGEDMIVLVDIGSHDEVY